MEIVCQRFSHPAIEFVTQQQDSASAEMYFVACGGFGVN
jgi:hypothetical protein